MVLVSAVLLIVLFSLVDLFLEAEFKHQQPLGSVQDVDRLVPQPLSSDVAMRWSLPDDSVFVPADVASGWRRMSPDSLDRGRARMLG